MSQCPSLAIKWVSVTVRLADKTDENIDLVVRYWGIVICDVSDCQCTGRLPQVKCFRENLTLLWSGKVTGVADHFVGQILKEKHKEKGESSERRI